MTTSARTGKGCLLYIGGSGTPKTGGTLVEEVVEFDLPDEVYEQLDATSHDSTAAEFISSFADGGELGITMNWTSATGQDALIALKGTDGSQYYINLPGGTGQAQLDFLGNISSDKFNPPLKGVLTRALKIKVTNGITINTQG